MRLTRTTAFVSLPVLGMGLAIASYAQQAISLQHTLAKGEAQMRQTRDRIKQLKLYNKDELTSAIAKFHALFLPQSRGSEVVERLTTLGKERNMAFIDISAKASDVPEGDAGLGEFKQTLKMLTVEMTWSGSFQQLAGFVQDVTRLQEFPLVIKELEIKEIKESPLKQERRRVRLVVCAYLSR